MDWIKLKESLSRADGGRADAMSRRELLAGIGCAGVFVVAGSTLPAPSAAEAHPNSRVIDPEAVPADTGKAEIAECTVPEGDLADAGAADFTDVGAQWRRRRWRRRYWRRRFWRRPFRHRRRRGVVCRRRWFRGRLVRVCRRVW
jgi:hypothetical protein